MADQRTTQLRSQTGLHVCPSCVSELVQPLTWAPAALDSWQVDLRCPNCEWTGRAIATQDEVDEYDIVLDDAARAMNQALLAAGSPAFDNELVAFLSDYERAARH